MQPTLTKRSFISASLGTLIEYYDFALFYIFLPMLAPAFFPGSSAYDSLIKGYIAMLIPAIARPLGALFFGYIGDAIGRRRALVSSMFGIAIATTVIGVIPSYSQIGIWAMIIVIAAKSIQLFCFGGEYNGAGIYVIEQAQNKQEGLVGSLLTAMTLAGSLLASFMGVILTAKFMPSWGWRLAFIVGGVIGFVGIIFRKNLPESPHFKKADPIKQNLVSLIRTYPKELLAGFFIGGLSTTPFTSVLVFILPVITTKGYITNQTMMLMHTCAILFAVMTLIGVGFLTNKISPQKIMQGAGWFFLIFSYPLLVLIDQLNVYTMFPIFLIMIIANEFYFGPSNAFFKNSFPMQFRYRGSSLGWCTGMAFFGSLSLIIESYLYHATHHFSAIALWLMFVSAGSLFSIHLVCKKQDILFERDVIHEG